MATLPATADEEATLRLTARAFLLPKAHTPMDDCEDALAMDVPSGRFAISDGAGTASYSQEWALLLANWMVASPPYAPSPDAAGLNAWLEPVQRNWRDAVPWETLSFFRKRKAMEGAYATAMSLVTDPPAFLTDGGYGWKRPCVGIRIAGVGDSCAFHIRDEAIRHAWFCESSADFGLAITALCSVPDENEPAAEAWKRVEAEGRAGDLWILTSDALSAFLLRQHEEGGEAWDETHSWLKSLLTPRESESERLFETFVAEQREVHRLRDDDVAMILLSLEADAARCGDVSGDFDEPIPEEG